MSITRRLFLRSVPPAVAAGTVVAIPVIAEANTETPRNEVRKSRHEQAVWHIRELERLIFEDGATTARVIVMGEGYPEGQRIRAIHVHPNIFVDDAGLFRAGGVS